VRNISESVTYALMILGGCPGDPKSNLARGPHLPDVGKCGAKANSGPFREILVTFVILTRRFFSNCAFPIVDHETGIFCAQPPARNSTLKGGPQLPAFVNCGAMPESAGPERRQWVSHPFVMGAPPLSPFSGGRSGESPLPCHLSSLRRRFYP
jgi:hypothetical protein